MQTRIPASALLVSAIAALSWSAQAADNPVRTVGPQRDGSIVASSNQTLTPAGRIVDLGSPVVAKAIALNPGKKARTGAALLMGAAQPVIVFDTGTGKVLQRFIPTSYDSGKFSSDQTGSFTGIVYSADGSRLLFSQDDNHVVIARVNPDTGLVSDDQNVTLPPPPVDAPDRADANRPYFNTKSINPGGIALSADGRRAYVALNAANTLGVIDLTGPRAKLVEGPAGFGNTDHRHVESAAFHHGLKGRENLLVRQVSRGAEKNETVRMGICHDASSQAAVSPDFSRWPPN